MDGEKERHRQYREEKECNEAENDRSYDNEEDQEEDSEVAALVWQEGYSKDNLSLPIMHWEALSLRIAELEKQEEEKKTKGGVGLERSRATVMEERGWRAERREAGDDACNSHVLALTSRLQTQMNLQLCFINDSESEEEEEEGEKENANTQRGSVQVLSQPPAKPEKPKAMGFRSTLRSLRDRLRADHKTLTPPGGCPVVQRTHLECRDLQKFSIKDLKSLSTSLSQAIQDLSSELVGLLQVRDQLRTEQDAMLLEIQDLTSLRAHPVLRGHIPLMFEQVSHSVSEPTSTGPKCTTQEARY